MTAKLSFNTVEQFYMAFLIKIMLREYKVGWPNVNVYNFKQDIYCMNQGTPVFFFVNRYIFTHLSHSPGLSNLYYCCYSLGVD